MPFTDTDVEELITAVQNFAVQLGRLGNGEASTPLGAIEALSMKQYEGAALIAEALHDVADALREGASEGKQGVGTPTGRSANYTRTPYDTSRRSERK